MDEEKLAALIDARVQSALAAALAAQKQTQAQAPAGDKISSEIEELRAALGRETDARKATERRALEQSAHARLVKSLSGKVHSGTEDMIATLIQRGREQVVYDKSGPKLRLGQVDYSIEDGVSEWLGSDEAKVFIPAPSAPSAPVKKTAGSKAGVKTGATTAQESDDPMARTLATLAAHGAI